MCSYPPIKVALSFEEIAGSKFRTDIFPYQARLKNLLCFSDSMHRKMESAERAYQEYQMKFRDVCFCVTASIRFSFDFHG